MTGEDTRSAMEKEADDLYDRYGREAPRPPADLDVPDHYVYIHYKAFAFVALGPAKYRNQDALHRPPVDWTPRQLESLQRGCEQVLVWRGIHPLTAFENLGIRGFRELLDLFHFRFVRQDLVEAGGGSFLDRIEWRHQVSGELLTLYNRVRREGTLEGVDRSEESRADAVSDAVATITPADFENLFAARTPVPRSFLGVCGRVARGDAPEAFERLTYSNRRLAWVLGPEEMRNLIGKSGTDIVLGIGKDRDWLRENLGKGMQWKLFVLPQAGMVAATWANVLALLAEHYPEVAPKLLRWDRELRDPGLVAAIDPSFTTSEVKDKEAHPRHMSLERYQTCADTPENARLFLWHTLGINHRFTGTGRTVNPDGSEGIGEYLMPNRPLAEFPGYRAIPLEVSLG